jgi:hypothetical protein
MKIRISTFCWQCYVDEFQDTDDSENLNKVRSSFPDILVDLNDNHFYEYICPSNHKTITRFQEHKFEILFDQATLALLDGYTKEAIATYSSALERFYEFYILAIALQHSVAIDDFVKVWGKMGKMSERQLGAFMILQLLNGDEMTYEEKFSTLRNDVIHKGYIPKTEQAIDYGEYVLNIIHKTVKNLQEIMPNFFTECTFAVYKMNASKLPKKVMMTYSGGPTLIGLNKIDSGEFGKNTLREILADESKYSFLRKIYFNDI